MRRIFRLSVAFRIGQVDWRRRHEVTKNEVEIAVVEIPPIMHGGAQQAFATENLHNERHDKMFCCLGVSGVAGRTVFFIPVNNADAVLNDFIVLRFDDRNNPTTNGWHNHLVKTRCGRGHIFKIGALLNQIGAGLAGIK